MDWLKWMLLVEGLGLAVLPLTWHALHRLPSRGLAYAKPFAILLVGLIAWLLPSLRIAPYSRELLLVTVAVSTLMIWLVWGKALIISLLRLRRAEVALLVLLSLIFWASAAWQAYLFALYPSIAVSEKPMNFAFVNAVNRSAWFPPEDPWFAGHPVNYYYLGHLLIAYLIRLAHVRAAVGFTLAGATLVALLAATLFALVVDIVLSWSWQLGRPWSRATLLLATTVGIGALWMTFFTGNLVPLAVSLREPQVVISWLMQGEPAWWKGPFHAHGRGGLSELPWRTYMLGYLHSFGIAMLYVVTMVGWCAHGWTKSYPSPDARIAFMGGRAWWITFSLLWSGAVLISPWVFPVTLLLAGVLVLPLLSRRSSADGDRWRTFTRWAAPLLKLALPFTLLVLLLALFARDYQAPPLKLQLDPASAVAIPLTTFLLQSGVKLALVGVLLGVRLAGFPWRRHGVWAAIAALPLGIAVYQGWIGGAAAISLLLLGLLLLAAGWR
ncbi:MAG: DUF2298 domain-containing protein, partial [Ardenticatenaceae bacterium]